MMGIEPNSLRQRSRFAAGLHLGLVRISLTLVGVGSEQFIVFDRVYPNLRFRDADGTSLTVSMLKQTSSDVTAVPSCHFRSLLSVKVIVDIGPVFTAE